MKKIVIVLLAVAQLLALAPAATAAPIDEAAAQDAVIPAGEVKLAATLYRPREAAGKLPAVIIAHGSAPTTRQMLRFYINLGLRMGFAVLAFDKRGTGASTGKFEEFSVEGSEKIFHTLAGDLVHSAGWLSSQSGIDEKRMGLLGGSQAGWVMPIAASNEPRLRFMVVGAGVPLSAGQADIQQAYLNAVNNTEDERFPLRQIFAADVAALDYRGKQGFDPEPLLKQINTDTLWIFGLFDYFIPTLPSIERIGELQKAGKRNHDIILLPLGDHNFVNIFTRERYDLVPLVTPWLRQKGILP
jgi:uncharacterized protein